MHNLGDFPTFSGDDILQLDTIFMQGKIRNTSTFVDGLVTAVGTSYIMKITDPTAFRNFINNNLNTPAGVTNFLDSYGDDQHQFIQQLGAANVIATYELALLQVTQNSGLTIFKGTLDSNTNLTSWAPITNQNSQVTQTNCTTLFPKQ